MKDIVKKLNEFKEIEPDEKFYHVTRSILLNTIEANDTVRQGFQFKSLFFNMNIFVRTVFPTMKVATISLVVMAMVFVTGLGAQAAGPDDILFNLKLVGETTQLLFTKEADKTQVHFKHIKNRLAEIDKLIEEDKSVHITKATQNIELNLKQVKKNLELMKNNKNVDSKQVVELASLIDLKTNELSESLKEKFVEAKDFEIKETLKASNSLSQDALEVIVTSDTELADAELELIKNSINTKIELQRDRYDEAIEKISKVQSNLSQEVDLIAEKDELDSEIDSVSTSTIDTDNMEKPVEFNISEITSLDSEEISDKLKKAEELLKDGNLDDAFRELKKAEFYIDMTTEETEKALEDYNVEIEELEKEIEEVKGVTEQVLE
jgi:tetratricopeptide (TPR) repeat protein